MPNYNLGSIKYPTWKLPTVSSSIYICDFSRSLARMSSTF